MKIVSKHLYAVLLVLIIVLALSGCFNTHNDWKVEAEVTNQMQLHEHGLTQREALIDSTVSHAVDQMQNDN